jgi:hypothetical protein
MLKTKYYLINMLDPFIKQTMCIMPNTNMRPTIYEEIAKGKFFIIKE